MILCLTGTSPYCFKRLIKVIDDKVALNHEVIIQRGYSNYQCVNSKSFDYLDRNELRELIERADLVISQGGYGSLMDCILKNKKIIAVPRLEIYNEVSGQDQKEIIDYFYSKNYLIPCFDLNNLEKLVDECLNNKFSFSHYKPETKNLIKDIISDYLESI